MEASTHYEWHRPGAALPIHISFDVLDEILQDVLRGFGAIPKRGAEVGGILLGRIDDGGIVVDGYESIACDYRLGPGYDFTDADRLRFAEAVEIARGGTRFQPVGYFRSHTAEGFAPSMEDFRRLQDHFPDARLPLLLIKPFATRVSKGMFLFRRNGALETSSEEFPVSRKLLGGGARKRREEEIAVPDPVPEPAPLPQPVVPIEAVPAPAPTVSEEPIAAAPVVLAAETARPPGRGTWMAALSLAVALGWSGGYLTHRYLPAAPDPQRYRLELRAEASGPDMIVSWNPTAEPIRSAARARMRLKNDAGEKSVRLDLDQLRQGRAVIRDSATSALEVELQIDQLAGSTVTETVQFAPR